MIYENRIAMVIRDDLQSWQKMNVAAFLASSVAIKFPESHGREFVTASESAFLPFIKMPMLIYKANSANEINRAFQRARDRDLNIGIYTSALFATRSEEENLIEIKKLKDEEHDLVGIVMYGESKKVGKALSGLKFHD